MTLPDVDETTALKLALALKMQPPPGVPPASLTILPSSALLLAYFGVLGALPWPSSTLHSFSCIIAFLPVTSVALHMLMTPTSMAPALTLL